MSITNRPKPGIPTMIRRLLSVILLSTTLYNACAQGNAWKLSDTIHIEPVTVIGNTPGISSGPQSVSTVGRELIEQSGQSAVLSALPAYVPGLFITERGATGFGVYSGSAGAITMRGVGASPTTQVLIAVDGQPQIMGINGHHLPDALRSSETERVEVLRGPASTMYGSNAMGGVINIITREPREGVRTTINGEYGSFNTQKYGVNNSIKAGRFSSHVSVGHDRTDGHRRFSAFRLTGGSAKVGYEISKHYKVTGNVSLSKYFSTDPGTIQKPAINDTLTADILRLMSSIGVENRYAKASGGLRVFYNYGSHDLYYGWESKDNNIGVSLYQTVTLFEGSSITGGIDFQRYGGRATDRSKPQFRLDRYINETAGYLIAKQAFFSSKLILSGGLRLQNNSRFGNELVPEGSVQYLPWRSSAFKISVAKGFRNPSIRELYVFAANEDLSPERMINYELSYIYNSRGGRLRAEIAAYISDGSNIIETEFVNGIPVKNFNSGAFVNKGVEAGVSYALSARLRLSANYSYVHASKAMLAAPRHLGNITGDYTIGKFNIMANLQYAGDLYTRVGAAPEKESFALLGSTVTFRPYKLLDIFVRANNILDQNYQMNYGYPMPGISVTGGIRITL